MTNLKKIMPVFIGWYQILFFPEKYIVTPDVTSPMGPAVKKELTGLDAVVPFRTYNGDTKVSIPVTGNKEPVVFKHQKNIVFANEDFMNLIGYQWIAGSAKTSLQQPYQTVLTETNAKLYFPKLALQEI